MIPIEGNIYFTGFMATGKSRIGELTAASLGRPFFDTDAVIEKQVGRTVSEIFADQGEAGFRTLELEVLTKLTTDYSQAVIALGGGTLTSPKAAEIVRSSGLLVGLWARPETILERVNRKDTRPLLSNLDDSAKLAKIKELLSQRESIYRMADVKFESKENVPHHILTRKLIRRLQIESLKPLWVELGDRRYPIYIEDDLLDHVDAVLEKTGLSGSHLVVTDFNLKLFQRDSLSRLISSIKKARTFVFKPGEDQKNLRSINKLFTFMLRHRYSRKTTLISFSGGVVGDMVGFAAGIFLRGVDFVQIPTTLLSMVDSSVGGKTGVNHPMGKNLIGLFHQPKAVVISTRVLATLPQEEYLAGMAEVIKYAVIRDPVFFGYLEENRQALLEKSGPELKYVIHRCCAIKAEIVGEDETEQGIRAILNYGHTFGHAFEALSGFGALTHGLAVALGMRAAGRLSVLLNLWTIEDEARQGNLLDAYGMPKTLSIPMDAEKIWDMMELDKKTEMGRRNFIVPTAIGRVKKMDGIPKELVKEALKVVSLDAMKPL